MAHATAALPDVIFREYDIRGVYGQTLTNETARLVGRAFAALARDRGFREVLVGRDNRTSSPSLARALIGGITAEGLDVLDIGQVVTPVLYWAREFYGIDPAVMITASHNPADENGFKLCLGPGTLYGESIQEIRRRAEALASGARAGTTATGATTGATAAGDQAGASAAGVTDTGTSAEAGASVAAAAEPTPAVTGLAEPAAPGATAVSVAADHRAPTAGRIGRVRCGNPIPAYCEMIAGRVALDRPLKVVVDAGNGTAGPFVPELFRALGCEVVPLYCESDPTFPNHHPDPVRPQNLQDLIRTVRETGADLGLAFDGDGDRLGVVDDQGQILWGDQLMILFWREILPCYPGATALVEVKCSQALVEEIERLGGKPLFHRTGHSYIKKSLRELGSPFAGEMSGHLFFADEYYGFDDALYAGARLCRLVSRSGRPLSTLWADVPRYPSTPEVRVACPEELKALVVEGVTKHFRGRYEVLTVDGARVLFPGGWGLVRASNTQPVLVLRCEGRTEADLARAKEEMAAALTRFPDLGPVEWR